MITEGHRGAFIPGEARQLLEHAYIKPREQEVFEKFTSALDTFRNKTREDPLWQQVYPTFLRNTLIWNALNMVRLNSSDLRESELFYKLRDIHTKQMAEKHAMLDPQDIYTKSSGNRVPPLKLAYNEIGSEFGKLMTSFPDELAEVYLGKEPRDMNHDDIIRRQAAVGALVVKLLETPEESYFDAPEEMDLPFGPYKRPERSHEVSAIVAPIQEAPADEEIGVKEQ